MKKLMFMLTAAAMAVATNAATVSWTVTGVTEGSTALNSGHTYMFFTDSAASAASQIAALTALEGKGATSLTTAMGAAAWNDTKKATAAGTFSIGTTAALGGYTLPKNEDLGLAGNTKYYAYAVIFDTETITDSSNYIIAQGAVTTNGATTRDSSSSMNTLFNLGSQASQTWHAVKTSTDVPEPTSGLLMLIGMAGLALRRKRA